MSRLRDGTWRRGRLAGGRLYLCAGRRVAQGDLGKFLDAVLRAGVDLVQLRDKTAAVSELREAAGVYRAAALRHDALFILNDDPALAAEVDADGVHVGQEDMAPDAARRLVGPQRIVGRSTHSIGEVQGALREDCDYFAVGPVHSTPTKQGRPAVGLQPLRHAAAVADRPWFVTGAMGPTTAPEVLGVGARRLVVVRAITDAPDPSAAAAALATLLRERR